MRNRSPGDQGEVVALIYFHARSLYFMKLATDRPDQNASFKSSDTVWQTIASNAYGADALKHSNANHGAKDPITQAYENQHLTVPELKELSLKTKVHAVSQPELTSDQKITVKQIEQDIKSGNLKALEKELHSFAGHADDLIPIINKVGKDVNFHAYGLLAQFSVGTYDTFDKSGAEHSRREGNFSLFSEKGGTALEINTDGKRIGTGMSPIKVTRHGKEFDYVDQEVGLSGNPQTLLEQLTQKMRTAKH
jgi:hypothetical protein